MVEMERLAHRGLWKDPSEKNTRVAFQRALEAGFGIETDLRDQAGKVVISHDPPGGSTDPAFSFEDFLSLYRDCKATGTLALNIKADGLASEIRGLLQKFELDQYFVFDMAFPDMLAYLKLGMKCFSRQSEFETPIVFGKQSPYGPIQGIWVDSFASIWYSTELVREHLAAGRDVCLVSPELHGRDPDPWWDELKAFLDNQQPESSRAVGHLMLCTDYPNKF